ncbi:MAG TPA: BamA/TamA family outer membrane protein [Gemmatimonadaceae bacterium]|nr:BamA/TamA family outer membrane protein [Gemmatimonadaceae bacterium]
MRLSTIIVIAGGATFGLVPATTNAQQRDDRAGATQTARIPKGWEISGVPALNFDADEGFGIGAALELYNYGSGVLPYRFTVQPTLLITSEGRRDLTVFFDGPALLGDGWRMTAFAGSERQLAQPYYGVGNATPYDPQLERAPNSYFYRFGRARLRASTDFQRRIGRSSGRVLLGAGVSRSTFDITPYDSGTTLLASQTGGLTPPASRTNYLRAGLLWDTRDQEIGPHRGTWAEAIVQRVDRKLGATEDFTRWTTTIRQYVPVSSRVVFAQRIIAQGIEGEPPFDELATIQSSFKQQEGLGGSGSIRGIPKDRYIGKALFLSNSELRWRAVDFGLFGRSSFLALSGFADAGRVWTDRFDASTMFSDLHVGYGGGVRLGFGPSFIVATDVGHSSESTAAVYIGLGWMY